MADSVKILGNIVSNVEKVIFGKKTAIELIVISLICDGHVLIEDVPGVGKTSLVSSLAKSINSSFRRIQFTPDILPSDITGFLMFNPKTGEFEFKHGSIMSNIILADEINRTSPKTQASMLEVMEENQVTVDGVTYKVPKPFMVLATQNPVEYLGTYQLPEAQLDRFFMKVSLGYPELPHEISILKKYQYENPIDNISPVADSEDIIFLQKQIRQVHVDESLDYYIVKIVSQTRNHPDISLGVSPRGSLALFRAAQGWAFYNGRDYVLPEDVKKMVYPTLGHRFILKQESKLKRISSTDILEQIVNNTTVPMVDHNEK